MDFEFTEEQKMFRDKVRRFAQEKLVPLPRDKWLNEETPWDVYRLIGKEGFCKVFRLPGPFISGPGSLNTSDRLTVNNMVTF